MAYGDSANWDGKLPTSLAAASYDVEWKVYWRGMSSLPFLRGTITLFPGEDAEDVADKLSREWNNQNPSGRQAEYEPAVNERQIVWGGAPDKMEFRVTGGPPVEVEYGVKVELFTGAGLFVFKS